jgi:hypothetical protein
LENVSAREILELASRATYGWMAVEAARYANDRDYWKKKYEELKEEK